MKDLKFYGPHLCPLCTGVNFYGRYIHRGEKDAPTCPNHKDETVYLMIGKGAKGEWIEPDDTW